MNPIRWQIVKVGHRLLLRRWAGPEPEAGRLFQERLCNDPFWMLVACILANKTPWTRAEPVFQALRSKFPTPDALAHARRRSLYSLLRPLGLGTQRTTNLLDLSRRWLDTTPRCVNIRSLPGCGRYAADSWAIFVEGRTDVEPTDAKLSWYLSKIRSNKNDPSQRRRD